MAQIPGMMNMPRTGPPRGAPPPFRSKAPAPKQKPQQMMAGGGFGTPGPLGGGAPPPAADAAGGSDPDMDGDVDSPTVKPEAVNYHDDPQSCSRCQYMGDGGNCSMLKMQVSPDGACNAFEGGPTADTDGDAGADTDMGDMGGPPPGGPPPPAPGGSPFGRGR